MKATPTLDNLFKLSRKFTEESNLASREVREALDTLKNKQASMIMLGNSIFALGAEESLSEFGETFILQTDTEGPRILTRTE